MAEKTTRSRETDRPDRAELVCAIGHEVGNHLAGIRLQAHLIDSEQDVRELASASVGIDRLAGRSAPLLALLRPIMSDQHKPAEATDWAALFGALSRDLDDEGTGGVRIEFDHRDAPESPTFALDGIHSLLMALIFATTDGLRRGDRVRVTAQRSESGCRVRIEDPGPVESLAPGAPLRGRPLVVAIARRLIEAVGGHVAIDEQAGAMRIELGFVNR